MSPEAERMALHAEWARRTTVQECIDVVNRVWAETEDSETIDSFVTRLAADLRHVAADRESTRAYSVVSEEYWGGRPHTPEQVYAARPAGNRDAVPDDAAALDLSCAGTGTRLR
jgi:hypothetical protein